MATKKAGPAKKKKTAKATSGLQKKLDAVKKRLDERAKKKKARAKGQIKR